MERSTFLRIVFSSAAAAVTACESNSGDPHAPVSSDNRIQTDYFETLSESLLSSVENGAIGVPVALRLYLQLTKDPGQLIPHAALGVDLAELWLDGGAKIVHLQGGVKSGYITILTQVGNGTAFVHSELIRPTTSPARVRVLLVGNQGSAEFEDSSAAPDNAGEFKVRSSSNLQATVEEIERLLDSTES